MTTTARGFSRGNGQAWKAAFYGVCILTTVTLTQWVCRSAISRDEMENIRWGQAMTWGSEKHPPLFGWIHYGWIEAFGRADISTYLLEKVNFLAGMLLLYVLIRRLLGRDRAMLATALTLATAYAIVMELKYNATSAMWPIWAGYLLCLHSAWRHGDLRWWVLTGLMAGLAVLTKYHSLLLLGCSLGFLLNDSGGRKRLADWRTWSGVIVGVAVVAPHVAWVWGHGGATVGYAVENVSEGSVLFRHLVEPVRYLAIQALCLLPALALLIRWARRSPGPVRASPDDGTLCFLLWHGPILGTAPAILSLVGGISLGSLWGMTSWGLFPAWMIARYGIDDSRGHTDIALKSAAALAGLVVVVYFINTAFIAEQRDYKGAAAAVLGAWEDRYSAPVNIVGGDERYYEGLGIYLPTRPDVFGRLDPAYHPRVDMARINREGAVLVIPETDEKALVLARSRFPVDDTVLLDLPARREGLRRLRAERLIVMFVAPAATAAGKPVSGDGS